MKVYIGIALTTAPPESHELYGELKRLVEASPRFIEVLGWLGLEAGTALDVYQHDIRMVEEADLCVWILDNPSIGLGLEIAERLMRSKPQLFFAHTSSRITRMVIGMLEAHDLPPIIRYDHVDEIASRIEEHSC